VQKAIETVAPTEAGVLILGETGVGKELVARAVHNLSARRDQPLVKVNCAAIPEGLIESEFFGHVRGAFTGAVAEKIGRFELADGGTIFLDEVGELPLGLQSKLLRVLQEGEFERVGGSRTRRVSVRVIAASNRDLAREVDEKRFRADLFYRLNVFPIDVPPLRDRPDDIPLLTGFFVQGMSTRLGRKVVSVHADVLSAFRKYSWPGNIRELAHVIERGVILSQGNTLMKGDWMTLGGAGSPSSKLKTLDEAQRDHILQVMEQVGWVVSGENGAAKILGIKPTTLEARMKKLGIERNL